MTTTLSSPPLGARGFPILLSSFYPGPATTSTSSSPTVSSVNGSANVGSTSPAISSTPSSPPTKLAPATGPVKTVTATATVATSSPMWLTSPRERTTANSASINSPTASTSPVLHQQLPAVPSPTSPTLPAVSAHYQPASPAVSIPSTPKSLSSPPLQSRHPHHLSSLQPTTPSPVQSAPLMKVNIVPKRSGSLSFSSTHYQVNGLQPQSQPQPPQQQATAPFSPSSSDSESLAGPKRRQLASPQRAYLEASEREMPPMGGMPKELAEFEHLLVRESQLLEQLKLQFKTGHHPASLSPQLSGNPHNQDLINELPLLTSEQQSKRVAQELRTILESKKVVLSTLMPSLVDSNESSKEQYPNRQSGGVPQTAVDRLMAITSQPAEIAVANRYLMPGPVIAVATGHLPKSETGTLIVSVKLLYHASGKEVTTTLHGKQDILQGIKQVTVDKLGRAIFNKLKVMEVSSKHRHQSFCLEFSLEEYSAQGVKRTITNAKSTPFHVQSRPAKRKREAGEEEGSPNGKEGEMTDIGSPNGGAACGQKKSSPAKDKKLKRSGDGSADGAADGETTKDPASTEGNYIDITDLLTLPQKEAAKKLGISESMLCKRFKECTRRKWPYRYLRKIDKIINMLNLHKADGEGMSEEDRDKLTRLHKEREECLRPVKIRITSYDRLSPILRHRKTSDCDEEDIPIDALQTLEMLRIFKPQGENELSEGGSAERDGNSSSEDDEDELEDDEEESGGKRKRSNKGSKEGGEEGEEEEQTDELRMDAEGEEDESECSMQLALDEQHLQQHDHQGLPFPGGGVSDGSLDGRVMMIMAKDEEDEVETVASGRLPC